MLVAVGVLSWAAREARDRRLVLVGNAGWVTADADSLYHMRRLERALDEGVVAGTDEYLNHPHGSAIPWPPYYTRALATVLGPFAPPHDEAGGAADSGAIRRAWIERSVASVPLVLGVLTTLLAALAGRWLGGNLGAALAGCYHALCTASIAYSKSGNGDHHAWISLLAGVLILGMSLVIGGSALRDPRRGALSGALLGAVAGLMIGSWVGALLYVIQVQLVLGWLMFVHRREPRPGFASFGLAFHAAALLAILPATLASPWVDEFPWMVVNLSWFHPAFLALGGLVFVPLLARCTEGWLRRYPWLVAGVLAVIGAVLAFAGGGPGEGLREGFAWVSRENAFMAEVGESRPLVGSGRWLDLADALGFGVFLLPVVVAWMTVTALRSTWCALIPWIVSLSLLSLQAARQARFADALALPLAVGLAWCVARALEPRLSWLARVPAVVALVLALALSGLCHWGSSGRVIGAWRTGEVAAQRKEPPGTLGARGACDWLRARERSDAGEAVMATWGVGHMIEWAADRPSVATNFGSYVGEDSFSDPCRFFMFEDAARAEALLEERRARWVLVTSRLPTFLNLMIDVGAPGQRERYVDTAALDIKLGWFHTMGARLLFDGEVYYPGVGPVEGARPLSFLRVVYLSPLRDPELPLRKPSDLSPSAVLWERVAGAEVEARGAPGEELAVRIRVRYAKAKRALTWSDRVQADGSGVARLRVPYATTAPNGDGWVSAEEAKWSFGGREGRLELSAEAVLSGESVRIGP